MSVEELSTLHVEQVAGQGGENSPGRTHRWLVKVEKLPEWNSQVAGQGGEVTREELTGGWSRWRSYQSGTHRWLVKVEKLPEWNSHWSRWRSWNSQVAGQGGEVTREELSGGWSRWRSYQSGHLSPGEEKLADGGLAEERAEVSGTTPPRLKTIQKI